MLINRELVDFGYAKLGKSLCLFCEKFFLIYNEAMAFIRKFKTASGATGVQVCYKVRGEVVKTVHIGSARSKVGVERLVKNAHKIMDADKQPLFNLSRFDKPKEK
ncbi:hypothetical protein IJG27_03170 [Candidatus Saccharibacteria bacterium]|nr:hypothetical protein [Candidatus Saccharibacteria bacterium]